MSKLKKYIRHSKTASRLEKGFLVDHSTLLSREMCFKGSGIYLLCAQINHSLSRTYLREEKNGLALTELLLLSFMFSVGLSAAHGCHNQQIHGRPQT